MRYAADDLRGLSGSLLQTGAAEWRDGLCAHGWLYAYAVRFVGDVRRDLEGRSPLGPLE